MVQQDNMNPETAAPAPSPDQAIFQILFGKMAAFALGGMARLGVADQVSDQPQPVQRIAAACSVEPEPLYRVMRMLSTFGIFAEHPGHSFSATPVTQMLRSSGPSMRDMILMMTDPWSIQSYQQIEHSIKTGGDAVTAAFGKHLFDMFHEIPDQAQNFHRAMTNFSSFVVQALLQVAEFSKFRRMADVGGGHGVLLGQILKHTPNLQGVLFDLPEVVAGATAAGNLKGVESRVALDGGSFFDRVPSDCDAYIMKHIIHDWDDDSCRRILSLMRDGLAKSAPKDGRVFLLEMVVPEGPEPHPSKFLDIEMLVCTRGGKERTATEFAELLASAGLKLKNITQTPSPMCLIEAEVA
jgi:hypothetical protein